MHINIKGAEKRPDNAIYQPAAGHNGPVQRATGLLSRDRLRRLVAAMVD